MDLTPTERDLVARTIASEAGDQPPEGQAAVAHVIMNRLQSGKYGKSVSDVLFKKGQFEPWSLPATDKNHPTRHDPSGATYRQASAALDDVLNGDEDPTGGATHFLDKRVVRKRRGGSLPSWASGEGIKIGGHTFYSPDAPKNGIDAINRATGQKDAGTPDNVALGFTADEGKGTKSDPEALFSKFEAKKASAEDDPEKAFSKFEAQSAAKPAAATTAPTSAAEDRGLKYPELGTATEAERQASLARGKGTDKPMLQRVEEAINPEPVLASAAKSIVEAGKKGIETIKSGVAQPNWLPTVEPKTSTIQTLAGPKEVSTPTVTETGKIAGTLGGLVQTAAAPISGPLEEFGTKPLEKLTGNKEFAERATMLVPGIGASKMAKAASPTVRALTDVVKTIPDAELPQALSMAARNPKLAPVDVSQAARDRAQTIGADRAAADAVSHINSFVKGRESNQRASIVDAAEVLGKLPDPHRVIQELDNRIARVGKEKIDPVVNSAKPADITGIVSDIDKAINSRSGLPPSVYQQKLIGLRDSLRGDRQARDKMFIDVGGEQGLHQIQSGLRADAQKMISKGGEDAQAGYKLMQIREKLINAVDDKRYRPALKDYGIAQNARDSVDIGLGIGKRPQLNADSIMEQSPGALRKWIENPKTHPDAIEAARYGGLMWAKHAIDGMREGKELLQSPRDPILREKLEILYGKKTADQFINEMSDLKEMADATKQVSTKGRSPTADLLSGAKIRPVRVPGSKEAENLSTLAQLGATGAMTGAAELGGHLMGAVQGTGSLIGAGVATGLITKNVIKHLVQKRNYSRDLIARLEEAKRLTTPFGQQPDFVAMLRERQAQISQSDKSPHVLASLMHQQRPITNAILP